MAWVGQFYGFANRKIAKECPVIGGLAGFLDPPMAFPTVLEGPNGPGQPGQPGDPHPPRVRREPAKAVVTPWMPVRTPIGT